MEKSVRQYKISKSGNLSSIVNESSGLARIKDRASFYTHNDSGGGAVLYEIDSTGKVLAEKDIPDARNVDWEDLASGDNGTLYIGDIGNNSNVRRDLGIYVVPPGEGPVEKIRFSYADQHDFPPPRNSQKFDSEAFFYLDSTLYIFTKNAPQTDHFVKLYQVPASPGDYRLPPEDSIRLKVQVTGADISPDGRTFALLTYGKILLFDVKDRKVDFGRPRSCIRFFRKQTEAILFLNDTDMMITNEQGKVYHIIKRRY